MASFERSRPIRKDQKANFSSPVVKGLGVRRDTANPANIGKIRDLPKSYVGGPGVDAVRKALRELQDVTGRDIKVPQLDEKFFGFLPDDEPVVPEAVDDRAMRLIHDLNQKAGRLVIRRMHTPRGFALCLINPDLEQIVRKEMRAMGLEQSSGPGRDEENRQLIWLRDAKTKLEHVSPHTNFEKLCENVTQSGKYTFESMADLRNFIFDRASRDGISGTRLELETQLVDFLTTSPPARSIFTSIEIGSEEHFVTEGRIK